MRASKKEGEGGRLVRMCVQRVALNETGERHERNNIGRERERERAGERARCGERESRGKGGDLR